MDFFQREQQQPRGDHDDADALVDGRQLIQSNERDQSGEQGHHSARQRKRLAEVAAGVSASQA
ncbi:hypothetical protein [Bradyrhizobium liaoningense]